MTRTLFQPPPTASRASSLSLASWQVSRLAGASTSLPLPHLHVSPYEDNELVRTHPGGGGGGGGGGGREGLTTSWTSLNPTLQTWPVDDQGYTSCIAWPQTGTNDVSRHLFLSFEADRYPRKARWMKLSVCCEEAGGGKCVRDWQLDADVLSLPTQYVIRKGLIRQASAQVGRITWHKV